ncbi:hypothetical protein [Hydrogenophaga sp. ANAO-22]|jgi:hypothetical protein|uniref:hypothetical protein n=1 Tax=Hydrogenophaga sp. ANAO-22 TaxID=3166645 RepID=UPI0036D30B33
MNAFHPLHISHHSLDPIALQPQDTVPSLQDLEDQAARAIRARNDFIHSRLPSSLSHCGYWLLAGVFATGSATMLGATAVWAATLGKDIYQATTSGHASPMGLAFSLTIGTASLGVPLIPARALAQLAVLTVRQITEDNEAIVQQLERDIEDACQRVAEAAKTLSPVEFERLLHRGVVPLPSLIAACTEDVEKASMLAQGLLEAGQAAPLLALASLGLHHCSEVGDVLLGALAAPQAFVALLASSPDAADVLAVLCMARNAMSDSAPEALEAYLQDHPDVARDALARLETRVANFGLHDLHDQIRQRRLAGVVMAIARHAPSLDAQPVPA